MFYVSSQKVVRLVEKEKSLNDFEPFRRTYNNMTELAHAQLEDELLDGAVDYAHELKIIKHSKLEMVVEWSKREKIVNYRFHSENATHVIAVVIQYNKKTETYLVIDKHSKIKDASKPKPVIIPCYHDTIEEEDGEEDETLDYSIDPTHEEGPLSKAKEYLKEF